MKAYLCSLLLLASAHAGASVMDFSVHAGYSSVAMGGLNQSNGVFWGWSGVDHWNRVDSAYVVGGDLGTHVLTPWPWLGLALRGEFLQTNLAVNDSRFDQAWDSANPSYLTDQGSLTSLLFGLKADAPFLFDGLRLGVGAWAGAGYGTLYQAVGDFGGGPLSNGLFTAWAPVEELEGTLQWRLFRHLSLSFSGGWRWADMPAMVDGAGRALVDNLQWWNFGVRKPVNVDFSGVTAQGGLSLDF